MRLAIAATLIAGGLVFACSPKSGASGGAGGTLAGGATGGAPVGASGGSSPGGVPGGGAGGTTSAGGLPPAGGEAGIPVTGDGGAPASGGAPPSAAGGAGTCGEAPVDPSALPGCPSCAGGRCVPTSDYPGAPVELLDSCGADSVCMPDPIVASKGNVLLPSCTSVSGAEGRCASLCIPQVRQLSAVLPQDVCSPEERCAPCYNPDDGTPSGICSVGCDTGPTKPAVVFPTCCSGSGRCVPRGNLPPDVASALAAETCTGGNDPVCVPSQVIQDPSYVFPACKATLPIPNTPGACVPACIVDQNDLGKLLSRGSCASATDKCVPCTNPATHMPTGACRN